MVSCIEHRTVDNDKIAAEPGLRATRRSMASRDSSATSCST